MKTSEQLISTDIHSNTSNYKFTYSVEIVPICKDDLVCLPMKLAKQLGDISPLVICHKVSNIVSLLDPNSLKMCELRASVFFESPFTSLCEAKDLVEFYIIDVQPENTRVGKYQLATVEVSLSKDLTKTFFTRTHLGAFLNPGDHALGYFIANSNFNNDNFSHFVERVGNASRHAHLGGGIPDVILVKKSYPNARRKRRNGGRNWRLKNLAKEKEEEELRGKNLAERTEMDYELFLRDIEEDEELRGMVNLYKGTSFNVMTHPSLDPRKNAKQQSNVQNVNDMDMSESEVQSEDDFPEINVDDLLDDMDALNIEDEEGDVMM
jgi:nonsense-mediated mRNA decay protein 3